LGSDGLAHGDAWAAFGRAAGLDKSVGSGIRQRIVHIQSEKNHLIAELELGQVVVAGPVGWVRSSELTAPRAGLELDIVQKLVFRILVVCC
jgi:hypothetical protein